MTSPNAAKRALPTDGEFESLFGPQIAEATRMLAGHAAVICQSCRGECCRRIECEFYSDRFDCCPIHEYRPVKCRLYYCEKILGDEVLSDEARWLLNRPARELSDRLREDQGLSIFIEPPVRIGGRSWLARFGIDDEVARLVRAVSSGVLSPEAGKARLTGLVRQSREQPARSVDDR